MDTNAGAMMGKAGAETVIAHAGVQSRHTNAGTLIKFAEWTRMPDAIVGRGRILFGPLANGERWMAHTACYYNISRKVRRER